MKCHVEIVFEYLEKIKGKDPIKIKEMCLKIIKRKELENISDIEEFFHTMTYEELEQCKKIVE